MNMKWVIHKVEETKDFIGKSCGTFCRRSIQTATRTMLRDFRALGPHILPTTIPFVGTQSWTIWNSKTSEYENMHQQIWEQLNIILMATWTGFQTTGLIGDCRSLPYQSIGRKGWRDLGNSWGKHGDNPFVLAQTQPFSTQLQACLEPASQVGFDRGRCGPWKKWHLGKWWERRFPWGKKEGVPKFVLWHCCEIRYHDIPLSSPASLASWHKHLKLWDLPDGSYDTAPIGLCLGFPFVCFWVRQ